jgi:hypothetical protein
VNELISADAFKWFLTGATGSVAGTWLVWDAIKLVRLRGRDPVSHDKRFGYLVGMTIGTIGLLGCLRFHGVI